jgi:hypothetical protein
MRITNRTLALAAVFALLATAVPGPARAGKPNIIKGCRKCHTAEPGTIRGKMKSVSEKFPTFQIAVGKVVWIVNYDDTVKIKEGDNVSGPERFSAIPAGKEILITYSGEEAKPLATQVAVKQPYEVPEEMLISLEDVKALVAKGPEAGNYTLIDARPPPPYLQGHIPTAKSLPYGAFEKKHAKVLPQDKASLVVFYCGGFT